MRGELGAGNESGLPDRIREAFTEADSVRDGGDYSRTGTWMAGKSTPL